MINFRSYLESVVDENDISRKIITQFNALYPKAGNLVDGRTVGDKIHNTSSISASLTDYYILPGIRDFPIYGFKGKSSYYAANDQRWVMELAKQIQISNRIDPVIIVEDKDGPYILEGGHRVAALVELKAHSIPALIVIDLESFEQNT